MSNAGQVCKECGSPDGYHLTKCSKYEQIPTHHPAECDDCGSIIRGYHRPGCPKRGKELDKPHLQIKESKPRATKPRAISVSKPEPESQINSNLEEAMKILSKINKHV